MNNIPDWMQSSDDYVPARDRDGFITKSLLSVMSVLSKFRATSDLSNGNIPDDRFLRKNRISTTCESPNENRTSAAGESPRDDRLGTPKESRTARTSGSYVSVSPPSAPVKFIMAFVMIVLAACSGNMIFTYFLLAVLLSHMCFLRDSALVRSFWGALAASAFSALLLLPAVFLGSTDSMLKVSLKVFLSVGLLGIMASTTPWNRITEGLRFFRISDIFIFTFDIALKYIVILGDMCVDMLNALKLRSVGKNNSKGNTLSGIPGVLFLKSRYMADEMCGAMACRGFEGTYRKGSGASFRKFDIVYLILLAGVIAFFVYLE